MNSKHIVEKVTSLSMVRGYDAQVHKAVLEHLEGNANTAVLHRKDGSELKLILLVRALHQGRCVGEIFGAEPVDFDPAEVANIDLVTNDMLMRPELSIDEILNELAPDTAQRLLDEMGITISSGRGETKH